MTADSRSRIQDDRVHLGIDLSAANLMGEDAFVGAGMWQKISPWILSHQNGEGVTGVESHVTALTVPCDILTDDSMRADGLRIFVFERCIGGASFASSRQQGYWHEHLCRSRLSLCRSTWQDGLPSFRHRWELILSRIAFGDFVGQHGDMIYLEDGNIVTARLGMLQNKEWRDADGFGHVYCEMSLCRALDGRTSKLPK